MEILQWEIFWDLLCLVGFLLKFQGTVWQGGLLPVRVRTSTTTSSRKEVSASCIHWTRGLNITVARDECTAIGSQAKEAQNLFLCDWPWEIGNGVDTSGWQPPLPFRCENVAQKRDLLLDKLEFGQRILVSVVSKVLQRPHTVMLALVLHRWHSPEVIHILQKSRTRRQVWWVMASSQSITIQSGTACKALWETSPGVTFSIEQEGKPELTVWVNWLGEEGIAQVNYGEPLCSQVNLQKDGVSVMHIRSGGLIALFTACRSCTKCNSSGAPFAWIFLTEKSVCTVELGQGTMISLFKRDWMTVSKPSIASGRKVSWRICLNVNQRTALYQTHIVLVRSPKVRDNWCIMNDISVLIFCAPILALLMDTWGFVKMDSNPKDLLMGTLTPRIC